MEYDMEYGVTSPCDGEKVVKDEGDLDQPGHSYLIEAVIEEVKDLNNQEGCYAGCFPGPAPAPASIEEPFFFEQQKTLTLKQVSDWCTATNLRPGSNLDVARPKVLAKLRRTCAKSRARANARAKNARAKIPERVPRLESLDTK
jgi:hypothetical protein